MASPNPLFRTSAVGTADRVIFDAGLRAHMQRVFSQMAGGLLITGIVAFLVSTPAIAPVIFGTPLKWLAILAPFGFLFYLNFRLSSMSLARAQTVFWLFCGAMGLSLGSLFIIYTAESIARTFFITSATFGTMALWGYTTKRDLSSFGAFLMMGVLGIFIASIVNIFFNAPMLQWIVSVLGVLIFTGLTAYDTQNIKQSYAESYGVEANGKMAVIGALQLYLNFINAFQFLLQLTGNNRN